MRRHARSAKRAAAAMLATLLFPSALYAQSGCGSAGKFAAEVWDAYLEGAREAGCSAPTQGRKKSLACALNLPVMALHLVDHMFGWWSSAANGAGPRSCRTALAGSAAS